MMFSARILIILLTIFQITSGLVKICREDDAHTPNQCIGVYVKPQWVIANTLCDRIYDKDAKILSGSSYRDCKTGKLIKIEKIWNLKGSENAALIKTNGSEDEKRQIIELGVGVNYRNAKNCIAYCQKCKKTIKPHSMMLIPCSELYNSSLPGIGERICLRESKDKALMASINESPVICDEKVIGYAKIMNVAGKNVEYLVPLNNFEGEIEDILRVHKRLRRNVKNNKESVEIKPGYRSLAMKSQDISHRGQKKDKVKSKTHKRKGHKKRQGSKKMKGKKDKRKSNKRKNKGKALKIINTLLD